MSNNQNEVVTKVRQGILPARGEGAAARRGHHRQRALSRDSRQRAEPGRRHGVGRLPPVARRAAREAARRRVGRRDRARRGAAAGAVARAVRGRRRATPRRSRATSWRGGRGRKWTRGTTPACSRTGARRSAGARHDAAPLAGGRGRRGPGVSDHRRWRLLGAGRHRPRRSRCGGAHASRRRRGCSRRPRPGAAWPGRWRSARPPRVIATVAACCGGASCADEPLRADAGRAADGGAARGRGPGGTAAARSERVRLEAGLRARRDDRSRRISRPWSTTRLGISLVVAFVWKECPYLTLTALAVLLTRSNELEDVARTLGASPRQVFWRVTWPQLWRGISPAVLAVFAFLVGRYEMPALLAPSDPMALPLLTYERSTDPSLSRRGDAHVLGLLALLVSALIVLGARPGAALERSLVGRESSNRTVAARRPGGLDPDAGPDAQPARAHAGVALSRDCCPAPSSRVGGAVARRTRPRHAALVTSLALALHHGRRQHRRGLSHRRTRSSGRVGSPGGWRWRWRSSP